MATRAAAAFEAGPPCVVLPLGVLPLFQRCHPAHAPAKGSTSARASAMPEEGGRIGSAELGDWIESSTEVVGTEVVTEVVGTEVVVWKGGRIAVGGALRMTHTLEAFHVCGGCKPGQGACTGCERRLWRAQEQKADRGGAALDGGDGLDALILELFVEAGEGELVRSRELRHRHPYQCRVIGASSSVPRHHCPVISAKSAAAPAPPQPHPQPPRGSRRRPRRFAARAGGGRWRGRRR